MSSRSTPLHRALAAIIVALAIAACGSDSTADTAASTSSSRPATTTTLPAGSVKVTLADLDATTMLLTPSPASVGAGSVTFVVTNSGDKEHEFVVLRTDLGAAELPFDESADRAEEEGEGVTPIDEIEELQPGETKNLTVDLETGHYVLICNLAGHYRMGMRSDFTVG
jgi:uncharacterized cupredoxin-like copper-binding protein